MQNYGINSFRKKKRNKQFNISDISYII